MARTYKRDSNGRFAGGSGGSPGGKGGRSKPASTGSKPKPASSGRSGPRGGKVGTRAEQRKAAAAQAARSAEFRGKSTAGRSAKAAYKAAQGVARKAGKGQSSNKPYSKISFTADAERRRSIRRQTTVGIREAYANQGGRKPTALESKKIARARQTAERARQWSSLSGRDRVRRSTTQKPASRVVARGQGRKARLSRSSRVIANRTGSVKKLTRYNSRQTPIRGKMIGNKYVMPNKLKGRQPLDLSYEADRAYGRVATKAAAVRARSRRR